MTSNKRPIHYEPHPVSAQRKAQLIAQGVQIVDARFAPKTVEPNPQAEQAQEQPKKKAKAAAKADEGGGHE